MIVLPTKKGSIHKAVNSRALMKGRTKVGQMVADLTRLVLRTEAPTRASQKVVKTTAQTSAEPTTGPEKTLAPNYWEWKRVERVVGQTMPV